MTRRTSDTELPLLRWGDQLRDAKAARRRQHRLFFLMGVPIGLLAAGAIWKPDIRLVWNATASAPIGLYAVYPGAETRVGDMVIARVPEPYRSIAAIRHYIPANVPLVKRVAAGPGDEVCAIGLTITIDGSPVVVRRTLDGQRRLMPAWSGCHVLTARQRFLLMATSPDSFDGRYFGITETRDILGKATPLWTR